MGKSPWFSHLIQQVVKRPQNSAWCREWWGEWVGWKRDNNWHAGGGQDGKGSLLLGRATLHLYRSVLYFANLLLCSAAILPKERGFENQERTAREKQAEDTHSKPDQSPCQGWSSSQAAHVVKLVRKLRGRGATGPLMKVMVLPSKHIQVGIHSRNSCCMDSTGNGFLTLLSPWLCWSCGQFSEKKEVSRAQLSALWGPRLAVEGNSVLLGKQPSPGLF